MNNNFSYIYSKLKKMCKCVKKHVSLSEMSSFKIGGKAKVVAEPESLEEIIKVVGYSDRTIKRYTDFADYCWKIEREGSKGETNDNL